MKNKISFVGLGKLGLPLATNFAKNGFKVIGIDINENTLESLRSRKAPWLEEGLQENINQSHKNMVYTNSYENAHNTDISIILVNTPSNKKDGSFSNIYIEQSLVSLCNNFVKYNKKRHHFILSSTVMPRSIKDNFIPLIENITGWKLNKDFGFSYVPDFVAIGQIIKDFENPDFLLIGASNKDCGDEAEFLYSKTIKKKSPVCRLNLAEAELCKVSLNAYVTTKISFANYLGILSKKIDSTINVDNVTNTIGLDKRIGKKFFKAGGPYGGTCFPRDTWAFEKISEKVGMSSKHMLANEDINDSVLTNIYTNVMTNKPENIGFIGLGFKPNTTVITEGTAFQLMSSFKNFSGKIHIHDHLMDCVMNFVSSFSDFKNFVLHESCSDLLSSVDTVIYCNNDSNYDKPTSDLKVVDVWRSI